MVFQRSFCAWVSIDALMRCCGDAGAGAGGAAGVSGGTAGDDGDSIGGCSPAVWRLQVCKQEREAKGITEILTNP